MTLTIDLTAANRTVPEDEFRQWGSTHSVFLSSVMGEFKDERHTVANALHNAGFTVRWFEDFGGRDDPPDAAYLTEVAAPTHLRRGHGRLLRDHAATPPRTRSRVGKVDELEVQTQSQATQAIKLALTVEWATGREHHARRAS